MRCYLITMGKQSIADISLSFVDDKRWSWRIAVSFYQFYEVKDSSPRFTPYIVKVQENSARGDRLTEGVASKLHFLYRKDYSKFYKDLSEATSAFDVAQDNEGAQVVSNA